MPFDSRTTQHGVRISAGNYSWTISVPALGYEDGFFSGDIDGDNVYGMRTAIVKAGQALADLNTYDAAGQGYDLARFLNHMEAALPYDQMPDVPEGASRAEILMATISLLRFGPQLGALFALVDSLA